MVSTYGPGHEPSAWLREVESLRLAQLDAFLAEGPIPADVTSIVLAIAGRHTLPGERADRVCDRCGVYVPPGLPLEGVVSQPRPGVYLVGGLCQACAQLEGVAS